MEERTKNKEHKTMNISISEVPIWMKYAWTFSEAASATNLGIHTLRALAKSDASFVLRVGTKTLLKQKQLLEFLDGINEINQ